MRSNRVFPMAFVLLAVLILPSGAAASDLGQVDFPTSASPAAQAHFLRGVAALHSFWYDEAADAFRDAQKAEPGFALAYWGEALTYDHPIWSEQDKDAALAALARLAPTPAERAAKAPTEREKAFLASVEVLYGEGERKARHTAYAEALQKVSARWPDDIDAASFYALSLIAPALNSPAGPQRDRALIQGAAILEEWFGSHPEHPGVLHYMIHAYDDPLHAPLGLRAARLYAKTAPSAHHALHMPSHIFVQIGDWPATAASNEAAWAASVDWVKRRGHTVDKQDFHSLSWLLYAYLQQGRLAKAKETLDLGLKLSEGHDIPRMMWSIRSMQGRWYLETGTWSADAMPAPRPPAQEMDASHQHGGRPMDSYAGNGSLLLALGLGAARSGAFADAWDALEQLKTLEEPILAKQVEGMILFKKGNASEAVRLLAEAADLESKEPAPMGPPTPAKPSHELYGEVLLELGQAEEAAKQFDIALLRMPNRTGSLLGAARAAAKLGDTATARRHYETLAGIWSQADPDFKMLAEVKTYLETRPAR